MKRHLTLLIVLLFCSQTSIGQNKIKSVETYTKNDGLILGNINSLAYDKNGWLWLGGSSSEVTESMFNDKELVLQRFNGHAFDTFKFDLNTGSGSNKLTQIITRKDGNFYLSVNAGLNNDYIYFFNTTTLDLKKIDLPNNEKATYIKLFHIKSSGKKNGIYAFLKVGDETKIYLLNTNFSFNYLFSITNNNKSLMGYTYFSPLKSHCIISEFRQGTNAFDWNGNLIKAYNTEKKITDKHNSFHISNSFSKDNKEYVFFKGLKNVYTYNKANKTYLKTQYQYNARQSFNDTLNNSILINASKNKLTINRFKDEENEITLTAIKGFTRGYTLNINHELWLTSKGKLHHIKFSNSKIKKYLPTYSIRNILEITKKEFLVATEHNGLFLINIETNAVQPYLLKHKGKNFTPLQIRGLIKDSTTIWSNYKSGIIKINTTTKNVDAWRYYPVECMYKSKNNTLFYGTIYKALFQFNKEKQESNIQYKTDSLWIIDIKQNQHNTLFAATDKGLLKYDAKTKTSKLLNKKDGLKDEYVLALQNHPEYDLLLGTKNGLLYSYNEDLNKFKLLYKDKLKAGIASVVFVNNDILWINTFNGIVRFNIKTKKKIRFSKEGGLSHNEMNRYSYLKTSDNHFFVGSIKGLNYFNPKDVVKQNKAARIALTSITNYKNGLKTIYNQEELSRLKRIVLPSENRYLKLEFATDNLNPKNDGIEYKYRFNNKDWVSLEGQNKLQFQNLEAGNYRLEIQAYDKSKNLVSNTINLEIVSRNFFYKTWWFALIGVSTIVLVSLYLIKQAQKRQQLEVEFSQNLIVTQEEERKRISRDLHDSIGQNLMLIKRRAVKNNDLNLESLAANTLDEMRTITKALHPSILEKLGLTSAITNFINEVDKNTNMFFTQEIENIDGVISKENEVHLYRIVQECISNIIKHSKSKVVYITISAHKKYLKMIIEDKGIGFDFDKKTTTNYSLGMKTLEERANIINATFSLKSVINKGTLLSFLIPITHNTK